MTQAAGQIVFDPHVGMAILCLAVALVAAVLAWALGLPDIREKRR